MVRPLVKNRCLKGTHRPSFLSEMKHFFIAGAGRFGRRALRVLSDSYPGARFMVVDRNEQMRSRCEAQQVITRVGEVVEILDERVGFEPPFWVIPAVPSHLAFEWLAHRMSKTHSVQRVPLPGGLTLPNPISGRCGDMYCSFADFLCPEECAEPERCTVTGERRSKPLFQLLQDLPVNGFTVQGLRSYQLAPGVGGYPSTDLRKLLGTVEQIGGNMVLFTACRCHGVLNALRVD